MSKSQVICIGEALIDKIIDNSGSTHKDYLGGAPANVACALRKLNEQTHHCHPRVARHKPHGHPLARSIWVTDCLQTGRQIP